MERFPNHTRSGRSKGGAFLPWLLALLLLGGAGARGAVQFDVFAGYDGTVREANWFPVSFEVYNSGPAFNAVIEISSGSFASDQVRRIPLEVPTNTRKRFILPAFSPGGRFLQWNARLVDERGKVRADRLNLQPSVVTWDGVLVGSLSRSFAGAPVLPEIRLDRPELMPKVARILPEHFPDNPLLLETLDAIYLNSERTLDLRPEQVEGLLIWVRNGGHLVVAIEQLPDLAGLPWLQLLLPMRLEGTRVMGMEGGPLYRWLQRAETRSHLHRPGDRRGRSMAGGGRAADPVPREQTFEPGEVLVASGILREAEVLLEAQGAPLLVAAPRGRGQISLLTFSPEREPFRSWSHRAWFWSRVFNLDSSWYQASPSQPFFGGSSVDGVFGSLLDSRQVRKMPWQWLIVLLVAYLIVIGPLDQYWLKRINRQMLTWVTFPAYVVFFSLLIYQIGKTLRKGETEWNELQVVDVLPSGNAAELRGRTWISVYASENSRFPLRSDQPYAALRGEVLDLFGGGRETSRGWVEQYGNAFRAEVSVPVWTSQLYVHEWVENGAPPFGLAVRETEAGWEVLMANPQTRPFQRAALVFQGMIFELGAFPAKSQRSFQVERIDGAPARRETPVAGEPRFPLTARFEDGKEIRGVLLPHFVRLHAQRYQQVVQSRRQAVGHAESGWLSNPEVHSMVLSFTAGGAGDSPHQGFFAPATFDLTPLVDRGYGLLLVWDEGMAASAPVNQFKSPRGTRHTLFRLAVPVQRGNAVQTSQVQF